MEFLESRGKRHELVKSFEETLSEFSTSPTNKDFLVQRRRVATAIANIIELGITGDRQALIDGIEAIITTADRLVSDHQLEELKYPSVLISPEMLVDPPQCPECTAPLTVSLSRGRGPTDLCRKCGYCRVG